MAKQILSGKLTSKGQLTIPIELRTLLKLEEGDRLEFVLDEYGNVKGIKPKKKKSIRSVLGLLKSQSPANFKDVRETAHKERAVEVRSKMENNMK